MPAVRTAVPPAPGRLGRPRDRALDQAILEAVRELLVERGYQALSVQEVTRRCGVHVRTIARRWPTKPALVAAAILGGDEPLFAAEPGMRPTGHLETDLRRLIERTVQYLADPATRAALPGLVSELSTPEVRDRFARRTLEWTAAIHAVLERAVASGSVPEQVLARGRLLPNVLAGTVFTLAWVGPVQPDDMQVDELTDFVLAALLTE